MKKLLFIGALVAAAWLLLRPRAVAPGKPVRPTAENAMPKSIPDWFAATSRVLGIFAQPTQRASEPPAWNWRDSDFRDSYDQVGDALSEMDSIDTADFYA